MSVAGTEHRQLVPVAPAASKQVTAGSLEDALTPVKLVKEAIHA